MAIIGGTFAKLGGGKFANGAMSAAFVHLFNQEQWYKLADAMKKMPHLLWGIIKKGPKTFYGFWTKMLPDTISNEKIPFGLRVGLKGITTATEIGATYGLSGRVQVAYDMFSGAFFSTYQTSINGFAGFYIKAYINDLRGVYYKDNSLNPYGF